MDGAAIVPEEKYFLLGDVLFSPEGLSRSK